jgi:5-oxoprolinase (ATP-hydrolysing)
VFYREDLVAHQRLVGPCIVLEATGTIVLEPGWVATLDEHGLLRAHDAGGPVATATSTARDPVLLEIFANRFMTISEQMGETLRRTALSTNIRERLDFSCAVFDAEGYLVANAPHIPVHLGAMGECVRAIRRRFPHPVAGDVFASNDPDEGGSHLPDITVVTPVHDGDRVAFWVASRGHHADVGGSTPGSMPPSATSLEEEGVTLRGVRIVVAGAFQREMVGAQLGSGRFPARRIAENLADLEAQVAANQAGARRLGELVREHGLEVVQAYMAHLQDDARACVAQLVAQLPEGASSWEDRLDDGTPIVVRVARHGARLVLDFRECGDEVRGNLNAPRAVTVAAVLYTLRTLVARPIPLNDGCLWDVEILLRPGSVLAPSSGRAVAGGNVETSQRVVDVLLGAFGRAAASQGTMNNLTFGDATFGYYETIGGGGGAGPGFDGASGVHTHMTNTRITDPEILEARYPVRLRRFALRRGSGGDGRYRGGDGVLRELEFLAPVQVSLLAERRSTTPFGLAGGRPGQAGECRLDGRAISGHTTFAARPGSVLLIATPGGGGYGTPGPGATP